jgi:NADPH:quinone reductase-like Zn-dependent oxidoreductase
LITNGNGSVGSFAIQIFKNYCLENELNIKIITTCSKYNFEKCKNFGA